MGIYFVCGMDSLSTMPPHHAKKISAKKINGESLSYTEGQASFPSHPTPPLEEHGNSMETGTTPLPDDTCETTVMLDEEAAATSSDQGVRKLQQYAPSYCQTPCICFRDCGGYFAGMCKMFPLNKAGSDKKMHGEKYVPWEVAVLKTLVCMLMGMFLIATSAFIIAASIYGIDTADAASIRRPLPMHVGSLHASGLQSHRNGTTGLSTAPKDGNSTEFEKGNNSTDLGKDENSRFSEMQQQAMERLQDLYYNLTVSGTHGE